MGTLVVHAGMPKAGSSSVQRWLGKQGRWLRDTHGLQLVSARSGQDPDRPEVAPCPSGSSESDQIGGRLTPDGAKALFDQLDRYLQRRESIVITSESFASWFYRSESHVLPALDELAATHPTRVAYYVRPQHTSLEAAWRQWGFREGSKPSDYLRGRMRSLRYFSTVQHVRGTAPNVQFIVRPFRMDLLLGGDVVTDFAVTCLGIDDFPAPRGSVGQSWFPAGARQPDAQRSSRIALVGTERQQQAQPASQHYGNVVGVREPQGTEVGGISCRRSATANSNRRTSA